MRLSSGAPLGKLKPEEKVIFRDKVIVDYSIDRLEFVAFMAGSVIIIFFTTIGILNLIFKGDVSEGSITGVILAIQFWILFYPIFRAFAIFEKIYKTPIMVTNSGIYVDKRFMHREDVSKSTYDLSRSVLRIYLKNGHCMKIYRDPRKIFLFGMFIKDCKCESFNYMGYEKALRRLGIPFQLLRKKGLFGTEIFRGKAAYDEVKHRERYEKWIKRQQKDCEK